ncbi:MAG: hypothetical protein MJ116_02865 [Lachnospiraceae bacterium]|nr:hypothetical protein [Lachnospiraceae bacterium]
MGSYFENLTEEEKKEIRERDIPIPVVIGNRPLSAEEKENADEKMRNILKKYSR